VGRGNAQPLGRAHNYGSEACSYSGLYQGKPCLSHHGNSATSTFRISFYEYHLSWVLRLLIPSLILLILLKTIQKKREKKIKDAVRNLFSFLAGKILC
jgi:hypothetical protein